MDRAAVEALITETYAARRIPDEERVIACFHPEASFEMVADPVLGPLAQPISGDQLAPALAEMCHTFDWSRFSIVDTVIDTGADPVRAAVRSAGTMIHTPSDIRFELETLDLLTFRDGRIVRFREYFDTHKAARMLGLGD